MFATKDLRSEILKRLKTEDLVVTPASENEYLELAHDFPYQIEYHKSEIYSMGLATTAHEIITGMFLTLLNVLFMEDKEYTVLGSNSGVHLPVFEGGYYMPDIMVVRGEMQYKPGSSCIITNPRIVVEVLSKSTSKFDTESKLPEYKKLKSVQQIIFIQQDTIGISSFTRSDDPTVWINHELSKTEQVVKVEDQEIEVSSIYKKVKF